MARNRVRTYLSLYLSLLVGLVCLYFAFVPMDNIPVIQSFFPLPDSPVMFLSAQLPFFVFLAPLVMLLMLFLSILYWRN